MKACLPILAAWVVPSAQHHLLIEKAGPGTIPGPACRTRLYRSLLGTRVVLLHPSLRFSYDLGQVFKVP